MILETDRLILRPWTQEDAPFLYKYAQDERIGPMAGWLPHTSVENSREIIRSVLSAPETYAVVLKETGEAVGSVGIMCKGQGSAPMSDTEREVGCWIGVPYWGRGLIPEAIRELLRRCFEDLDCTAVWYGYFEGNEKSKRVQEKCGFTHCLRMGNMGCAIEGLVRTEYFSILTKEDWEKQHS